MLLEGWYEGVLGFMSEAMESHEILSHGSAVTDASMEGYSVNIPGGKETSYLGPLHFSGEGSICSQALTATLNGIHLDVEFVMESK